MPTPIAMLCEGDNNSSLYFSTGKLNKEDLIGFWPLIYYT